MLLEQLRRFDQGLRRSLEIICRSSVTDMAWLQATLPIRLGGLGLREAVQSSPAAYIGSCNSTRKMVQDFLKKACNSLDIANLRFSSPLLSGDYENSSSDLFLPEKQTRSFEFRGQHCCSMTNPIRI